MTLRGTSKLHPRQTLALVVGVGGLLLGLLLTLLPPDIEQSLGLPALFHGRGSVAPPADVVIIALEQGSARRLSLPAAYNRWPRELHARLINNLRRAGARLIVYDVLFGKNALQSAASTAALALATAQAGNVILSSSLDNLSHEAGGTAATSDIAELQPRDDGAADVATISQCQLPGADLGDGALGVAPFVLPPQSRRADSFWTYNSSPCNSPTIPALALQALATEVWPEFLELIGNASTRPRNDLSDLPPLGPRTMLALRQRFADDPGLMARVTEALDARRRTLESDAHRHRLLVALVGLYGGPEARYLNPIGPALSFPTIAFADAVTADVDPKRWASFQSKVAGRVVFVGASELSIEDQKNSMDAFNTVYDEPSGLRLQGVEIVTTAFVNLLHSSDLKRSTTAANIVLIAMESLLLAAFWALLSLPVAAAATGCLTVAYGILCISRFASAAVWLPLVTPVAIAAVSMPLAWLGRYLHLVQERRLIVRAVQRRLPPGLTGEFLRTGHVKRTVQGVCLASDVGNWTRLAARVSETELGERMRRYISSLFGCAENHGGYPVDAAGDGMLAIWVDEADSSLERRRRACLAALDILRVGAEELQMDGQPLPIRIGLSSGDLALRDVGGDTQFQVKPFGLTVNLTNRIEALNKRLGTQVLGSIEMTRGLDEFLWRPLGSFVVEGIDSPIAIAELMCRREGASVRQQRVSELFAVAMHHYETQQFENACKTLQQILALTPGDGPAAFYLHCIGAIDRRSVGEQWSAVIRIDKDGSTYPVTGRRVEWGG